MTKRILLLTIFAMPTLFGASSSNNNQVITKGDFELLAQDFMNAVQHKNAEGALAQHKQMRSKFGRKKRTEIADLIDTPAFRGLILHEADNNRSIKQFFDCYVPQHPIAQQIRKNDLSKLRAQHQEEQEKIEKERKTNLQKLIKAHENQEALKTAENNFLSLMAIYDHTQNKRTHVEQLSSAYDHIQSINQETAKSLAESPEFRKLFNQLIQQKNKYGLQILNKLYNNNNELVQLADPILYPAPVASQKMVLFDDVNNNTSGGVTQLQTPVTQESALDTALKASLLTAQQNLNDDDEMLKIALAISQQPQYLSKSSSSDDDDSVIFPSSSSDQHNKQTKHDHTLSQEEQDIQCAVLLSQQQPIFTSTGSNLDNAKQLANALLQSKHNENSILHIQDTITQIMDEVSTSALTANELTELRQHIVQLLSNDADDDSSENDDDDSSENDDFLDNTQQQQDEIEQNNNTNLFVGGAITTAIIAGIIFLFSNK